MGAYATVETKIGHWKCIVAEENCAEYDDEGNFVRWIGSEDGEVWGQHNDIKMGRMHDYSLYSYGEIEVNGISYSHTKDARHFGYYDIGATLPDYYDKIGHVTAEDEREDGGDSGDYQHDKGDKWHDNRKINDTGKWSRISTLFDGQKDYSMPDQVPDAWNESNENY